MVTHCFSFPLSNSTVILSLFALSTNCTVTCYLQTFCTLFQFPSNQFYSYPLTVHSQYQLYRYLLPSEHIRYHNVVRQVMTALCHILLYLELRLSHF